MEENNINNGNHFDSRNIKNPNKIKRKMNMQEQEKKKKNIIRVFIIILSILVLGIIAFMVNEFVVIDDTKTTDLVINNKNVTDNLKNAVLFKDNTIYISKDDIENFFDKHIYEVQIDGKDTIVTTYDKKIAEINFEDKNLNINGSDKKIYAHAINENGVEYLPISEMKDVYGIDISKIDSTNVVTIDSTDREQVQAIVKSSVSVKSSTNFISRTTDRISQDAYVYVVSKTDDGWAKVRTENGKLGYIKADKLVNETVVREDMGEEQQVQGKINMIWDYFSAYGSAPDRSGTSIQGVNVVSPAFFYLDNNGKLQENVGDKGIAYIKWAKDNGYKVWPMVSNSGNGMLTVTSNIMNSYEKRKALIESIVDVCVKYDLDGINIDFENMKEEDKDLYSRFIIELTPRIKEIGDVISVDVTAPDGGETWSMCFDRHVIGDVADYIIFMAYDEYGVSSDKAGTTAGYDWVELSLKKFLTTEEIDSNKIILGIPFYTRLWTEDGSGKATSKVVYMKNIDSTIPNNALKKWDDKLKQNYAEYQDGNTTKKIWIEDENSIKHKLTLITDNQLAGVSSWAKDMEKDNIWKIIDEELKK